MAKWVGSIVFGAVSGVVIGLWLGHPWLSMLVAFVGGFVISVVDTHPSWKATNEALRRAREDEDG